MKLIRLRILALYLAAVLAGGLAEVAAAQTTTGSAVLVPVDAYGHPIAVEISGGGLNIPGSVQKPVGYSCTITAGALGTCNVPDEITAQPSGFHYNITISDTTTFGHPTSGMSFLLPSVGGITGGSFALDLYVPTASVPTTAALTFTSGSGTPVGACTAPALYTNTVSSTLYQCVAGAWVQIIGAGGAVNSLTTTGSGAATLAAGVLNIPVGGNQFSVMNYAGNSGGTIDNSAAVTAACAANGQVFFPVGTYNFTSNYTVPCPSTYQIGAALKAPNAVTVTLGAQPSALPSQQIFVWAGTGKFVGLSGTIPVEWFGVKSYQTLAAAAAAADDTAGFAATLTAVAMRGNALLQCAVYNASSTILVSTSSTGIHGSCPGIIGAPFPATGIPSTIISTSPSADIIDLIGTSLAWLDWNIFDNFTVQRTSGPTGTAAGINVLYAGGFVLNRIVSADSICDFGFNSAAGYTGEVSFNAAVFGQVFAYTADTTGWCVTGNTPSLYFVNDQTANTNSLHSGVARGILIEGSNIRDQIWTNYTDAGMDFPITIHNTGTDKDDDIHFINAILDGFDGTGVTIENIFPAAGGGGGITFVDGYMSGGGDGAKDFDIKSSSGIIIGPMQIEGSGNPVLTVDNSLGGVSSEINIHDLYVSLSTGSTNVNPFLISNTKNSTFHDNIFDTGGSTAAITITNGHGLAVHGNSISNAGAGIKVDGTSGHNSVTGNTCDAVTVTGACLADLSSTDVWIDPATGNAQFPGTISSGTGISGLPAAIWKVCGDISGGSGCVPTSSTVAYDSSGNGLNGTWNGTQSGTTNWYSASTPEVYAGTFDGSTDYIQTGYTPSGLTNFTLSAWIYVPAWGTEFAVSSRTTAANGIMLFMNGGSGTNMFVYGGFSDGSGNSTLANATTTIGAWHCVAETHVAGATNVTLYIDGVSSGVPTSGSTATNPGSGGPLYIGKDGNGGNYWNGMINDVRVYPSVLPSGAIPGCI